MLTKELVRVGGTEPTAEQWEAVFAEKARVTIAEARTYPTLKQLFVAEHTLVARSMIQGDYERLFPKWYKELTMKNESS